MRTCPDKGNFDNSTSTPNRAKGRPRKEPVVPPEGHIISATSQRTRVRGERTRGVGRGEGASKGATIKGTTS